MRYAIGSIKESMLLPLRVIAATVYFFSVVRRYSFSDDISTVVSKAKTKISMKLTIIY